MTFFTVPAVKTSNLTNNILFEVRQREKREKGGCKIEILLPWAGGGGQESNISVLSAPTQRPLVLLVEIISILRSVHTKYQVRHEPFRKQLPAVLFLRIC
jgi:hypothetical protein